MFPRFVITVLCAVVCVAAAPIKIACVGDSITEGSNLSSPSTESYPARLQKLFGTNYNVRNFGISGRTLLKQGDFPYWKEAAFTNSRTFGPDIVIIQLGTNDGKPYNWIYGTNFIRDYKEMIGIYAALSSAPKIFLCAPCPVYKTGGYDISPGTVNTNIAPKVRDLAVELALPLIDLNARMTNATWFPDNVHPNSKGMSAMAAVMFENLSGGFPNEAPPPLQVQRPTSLRVILSWPANWAGLVPQTAVALAVTTNTAWTIQETGIPTSDGVTIRQTNTFGSNPQRWFQLARP